MTSFLENRPFEISLYIGSGISFFLHYYKEYDEIEAGELYFLRYGLLLTLLLATKIEGLRLL